jgi:hypothetical protein
VRVRVTVGVGLVLCAIALALVMSARGARISGTDHINPVGFVASLKSGQTLCQPAMILPSDAQRVQVLVGTFGPAAPQLTASFIDSAGHPRTRGRLAAGAPQGNISIPLAYPHGRTTTGTLCIGVGPLREDRLVLGGDIFPAGPSSERVGSQPQAGRISVTFFRPGRQTWWQMLSTVSSRFGYGKASIFGGWTFPVAVLVLLGLWVAVSRLLIRELL